MENPSEISFQELLDALLDTAAPLQPRFLYRLSGLEGEEVDHLEANWKKLPLQRRRSLLEDLEELAESNYLMSFDAVFRLALFDEDAHARLLALRSLWECEQPDLAPIFLDILDNDPSTETRAQAAAALGRFVYMGELEEFPQEELKKIESRLLEIMDSDEHPLIRRRAMESLGFSGQSAVVPWIEEAYEYGDEEWLVSALLAMGRSANQRWAPQVLEKLDDLTPEVRLLAARAAGELDLKDAVEALLALLDDQVDEIRMAAAWSLSELGGEGVREALEDLFERTDDEDEIDLLENALDNLAFTEDIQDLNLFDFSGYDLDDLVNSSEEDLPG